MGCMQHHSCQLTGRRKETINRKAAMKGKEGTKEGKEGKAQKAI